jgi:hypothetical protein
LAVEVGLVVLEAGEVSFGRGSAEEMDVLMRVGEAKPIKPPKRSLNTTLNAVEQCHSIMRFLLHGEGVVNDEAQVDHQSPNYYLITIFKYESFPPKQSTVSSYMHNPINRNLLI